MPPKRASASEKAKIKEQFKTLDRNNDGTLSFKEMKQLLKKIEPSFSEHQLQKLFCSIDTNRNGKLELTEFCNFIFDGKKASPRAPAEPPTRTPTAVGVREVWKQATLDAHNERRKLHGSAPLTWNDECYIEAKKQADACQEKSELFHGHLQGPSGRHGQNAYWCSAPGSKAGSVVGSWYGEITAPGYDFDKPGSSPGTGHFTQVVWKGTKEVGMAVSEDGCFVVANYLPSGNWVGRYGDNVLPPSGSAPSPAGQGEEAVQEAVESEEEEEEPAASEEKKTCEGSSMTPEMEAMFEGCPFPFKDKVEEAFAQGASVEVEREPQGAVTKMTVKIKSGFSTTTMRGSWGGG